jgi:hypothetical protein
LMTWSLAVGTDLSGKEHLGTLAKTLLFVSTNLLCDGAFEFLLHTCDRTQLFLEKVDSTLSSLCTRPPYLPRLSKCPRHLVTTPRYLTERH